MLAIGESCADQEVAFVQIDSDDAAFAWVVEFVQRSFLDGAHRGRHEHIVIGREGAHIASQRQDHVDFFAFDQREHIDDGAAA